MSAKLIYLARRNPRLSRDEFPKRWRKHAASVGGGAPEVLSEIRSTHYCLVRPSRDVLPASSDEYDGVGLVRLRGLGSIPAMHHNMVTNEITLADELRTFDSYVKDFAVYCAEDVLVDGPTTGVALIHFVRRAPGAAPSRFAAAWRGYADELGARLTGKVQRHVLNEVIAPAPPGFAYAGVQEIWCETVDDLLTAAREANGLQAAANSWLQPRTGVLLVTEPIFAWEP